MDSPWEMAAQHFEVADNLLPHQRPPTHPFRLFLLEGGRGSAKTYALTSYLVKYARRHPGMRARLISPTLGDAVEACIDGPSGVRALDPGAKWLPSAPGGSKLEWANGSECLVMGTNTLRDVERLRASGNRWLDLWDEMAANPSLGEAWKQASMGLRSGPHPHSVAATTPKPSKAYREIRQIARKDGTLRHATMEDNPYLSEEWKAHMRALYGGTRLGRQEIGGELLDDIEGALWTSILIDAGRVRESPDLARVVIGVDPSGGGGDEQGIVVVGRTADHYFVLADRSCALSPDAWGRRVVQAYDEFDADLIVVEKNYGGDMAEAVIKAAAAAMSRPNPNIKPVWASRGKRLRAEPVAALYGDPDKPDESQPKVHHVGTFPDLEDQLLEWTPDSGYSPDRLDALVFALSELVETRYAIGDVWVPGGVF